MPSDSPRTEEHVCNFPEVAAIGSQFTCYDCNTIWELTRDDDGFLCCDSCGEVIVEESYEH
jgi:hypothetical protein